MTKKEIYNLKGKNFPPIHHWCDEGILSWYEIAIAIREISKDIGIISNPATIEPINSEDYKFMATRPKYSVLDCNETERVLGIKRQNWRNSLLEILQSISENKGLLFKD